MGRTSARVLRGRRSTLWRPLAQHQKSCAGAQRREQEGRRAESEQIGEHASGKHGEEGARSGDTVVKAQVVAAAANVASFERSEIPAEPQERPADAPQKARCQKQREPGAHSVGRCRQSRSEHRDHERDAHADSLDDAPGDGVGGKPHEAVRTQQQADHPELEPELGPHHRQHGVEQRVSEERSRGRE